MHFQQLGRTEVVYRQEARDQLLALQKFICLEIGERNMCWELTSVDGEVNEINRQDGEPYSKIIVLDAD